MKRLRKEKYYVVNSNCSGYYSNLKKAIKDIKANIYGEELTNVYRLENGNIAVSDLGCDDLLLEFKNNKLIKDWRIKKC